MEVKIQIPDNCELIKDGDTYIVKEKKDNKPRSWEEFCKNYPITEKEYYIDKDSHLVDTLGWTNRRRKCDCDKHFCASREEAKAFLALMQLRQLRKAWIGNWTNTDDVVVYSIYADLRALLQVDQFSVDRVLNFPTREMAEEFLTCFKDLCETAKILL